MLELLATDAAGISSDVALLWGGIATVAGAAMSGAIAKLFYENRDLRSTQKDERATMRAAHDVALKAERDKHESLRLECANELKALHQIHAAALERFGDTMREELCPACRAEKERDGRGSDHGRRT